MLVTIIETEWGRMEKRQYVCDKCGNTHYVSDQFQATGGNFSEIYHSELYEMRIYGIVSWSNIRWLECFRLFNGWLIAHKINEKKEFKCVIHLNSFLFKLVAVDHLLIHYHYFCGTFPSTR